MSLILPHRGRLQTASPFYVYTKYSWIDAGFDTETSDTSSVTLTGYDLGDPANAGDGKLIMFSGVYGDFDDVDTPAVSVVTIDGQNFTNANYASPTRNGMVTGHLMDAGAISGTQSISVSLSKNVNLFAGELAYMYYDKAFPPALTYRDGELLDALQLTYSGTTLLNRSGYAPATWDNFRWFGTAVADDGDETDTWSWSNATEESGFPVSDATEGWTASVAYGSTATEPQPSRTGASSANGRVYPVLWSSAETAATIVGTTTGGSDTDVSNSGGTISVTLPGGTSDGDDFFVFLSFEASANMDQDDLDATVFGTGASAVKTLSLSYGASRFSAAVFHFRRGSGVPLGFTITNNDTAANITCHQWFAIAASNVNGYAMSRHLFSTNASATTTANMNMQSLVTNDPTIRAFYHVGCHGTTITGSTPAGWTLDQEASLSEMDAHLYYKSDADYNESIGAISFAGASTGARTDILAIW